MKMIRLLIEETYWIRYYRVHFDATSSGSDTTMSDDSSLFIITYRITGCASQRAKLHLARALTGRAEARKNKGAPEARFSSAL